MPQRIVEIANTLGLSAVQIDGAVASEEIAYVSSASTPCCEACRAPPTTIW